MSEEQSEKKYVGPYCLVKLINTGQSCQLWQAADEKKRKFVALKRLLPELRRVPTEIELLKWEFAVASKLKSPYCIPAVEYALDSRENPYLVSEWFPGLSMKAVLKSGIQYLSWRMPDAIPQMINALGDVHKQGYVHRDVKPDNFLINAQNEIKVIDFAIAQSTGLLASLFGGKQKIQGTRSYMSPEQIRGQRVDVRADIYSLGCTFFELLGGKTPYQGTPDEVLQQQLSAPVPNVIELDSNVSKDFNDIIRKMMFKEPKKRFASMAELTEALGRIKLFIHKPLAPKKQQ